MRYVKISADGTTMALDPSGNCAQAATPSDDGRGQSQRRKAMLDTGGVASDAMLTSPCCRAKETAPLAFGTATVDPNFAALALAEELGLRPGAAAPNALEGPVEMRM